MGVGLNLVGVGPGGFYFGGDWLYRLSSRVWFDGRVAFLIGGGKTDCTTRATGASECSSTMTNGFGTDLLVGLRWFPTDEAGVIPWFGTGIGFGLVDFTGDRLAGLRLPFWAGVGARKTIADGVAIGGEAVATFGPTYLGRDLGWRGDFGLILSFGVDFRL